MAHKERQPESLESRRRLLVVDDEPLVAETVRDILEYEGSEVEIAENGKSALDRLMNGTRFDLMINDIKPPEIDGVELLTRPRELKESILVVVLTGYASFKKSLEAIREGIFGYVLKPFRPQLLMNTVHRPAGYHLRGASQSTISGLFL
jgi:DNA-binding NtrC family response regulator